MRFHRAASAVSNASPSRAVRAQARARQRGQVHLKGLFIFGVLALAAGYADPSVTQGRLNGLAAQVLRNGRHAQPHSAVLAQRAIAVQVSPPAAAAAQPAATHTAPPAPASSIRTTVRSLRVTAGAYCLLGRTATGTRAGPGSIAVDPSVIPYGSHLFVPGYGYGYAVDTGGSLRGAMINVWEPCRQAKLWGRRPVTVQVLSQ